MAARTVYKMQAKVQTLAFNSGEFFWVEATVGWRLVNAVPPLATAIDVLPAVQPAALPPGTPLRHAIRREALPPPVDESDRLAIQNEAGILGCSP
jgi:hypothetical protein